MTFFKNNFWLVLILSSFLVGALYSLPQFLIWKNLYDSGQEYAVIQLTHHSDEAYGHMPIAREIYDGRFPPSDLYFNQKTPSLFGPFPIPYMLMAFFIWLFHGNINAAYTGIHFVAPAFLFVLFVWLGLVITRRQSWAFVVGFVGTLTPIVYHLPYAFKSWDNFLNVVVKNFYPLIKTPLPDLFLSRTMDSLLTYLVFIPAIIALIIFWRSPSKRTGVWAGVMLGALYYTYFHYWVFMTIAAGLLGLVALWQRKESSARWRAMLWLAGTVALVTIPYWVNFFQYMRLPNSREVTDGLGTMEYGRSLRLFPVIFEYLFYGALGLIVYWFWWRGSERTSREQAILYWAFIVAMFITWNVQVIAGYVPQPDHWPRTFSPFIFVMSVHVLYELSRRINQRTVAIGLVILSLLLVVKKINNIFIFVNPPAQVLVEYSFNPRVVGSWQWINKNVSGEPVIASPSFISSLYFTTETAARPYLATRVNSSVPNSVLEDRFLETYKAFGASSAMVEQLLRSDPRELCSKFVDCSIANTNDTQNWLKTPRNLYSSYYRNQIRSDAPTIFRHVTEDKVRELVQRYQQLPPVSWDQLNAGYIYYGHWEKQLAQSSFNPNSDLSLIYQNSETKIYKLQK